MMAVDSIKQLSFNAVCANNPIMGRHRHINLTKSFNFDANDKYDNSTLSQIDPDMNFSQYHI